MSDKHTKSKLKRKKSTVEKPRLGQPAKIKELNENRCTSRETYDCSKGTTVQGRERWWDRPDLRKVEKLWVCMLTSISPGLEQAGWGCVPVLPPALERPDGNKQSEWKWCCVDEEVGPFPKPLTDPDPCEILSPANSNSQSPQPSHLRPVPQDVKPHPKRAKPHFSLGQEKFNVEISSSLDEHEKETNPQITTAYRRRHEEEPRLHQGQRNGPDGTVCLWEEVRERRQRTVESDRHGTSAFGWRGAERDGIGAVMGSSSLEKALSGRGEQADMIKQQLPALRGDGSDSCAPAGGSGIGSVNPPVGDGNVSGKVGADTGITLECCPMCLMPFPAGFTQMDCDGHLAQCLSEMNTDIVW